MDEIPGGKIPDPEKKGEYFYRCEGITLYSEKELEELAGLLQGKLFDGLHRRALVLWGYRMERIFLPATEWNAAEGEIHLSFLGGAPAKYRQTIKDTG